MESLKNNEQLKTTVRWLDNNRSNFLRYAIIFVVFSASLYLAPRVGLGYRNPTLLSLFIFAIGLVIIILRYPALGLIFVLLGGVYVPFSWQGGFNMSQIGLAAMLGVWLLDMLVIKRKFQIAQSRAMLPILIFVLISILSFLLGQFPWYPFAQNAPNTAQIGGLTINLLSAGAFLLVTHFINNLRKLEFLTWTFIAIGSIYIIGRFLRLGMIDRLYEGGFTRGSMYWTWLVALLAGQVITNKTLNNKIRILLGFCLLLTLYVAVKQAYDWKSGWFPPLVCIAVIIAVKYWRYIWYLVLLAMIPFYSVVTTSIGAEDWSWGTRLDAWKTVLNIAKIDPILGTGFANYYWYAPLFSIRGYYIRFNSHSQYVDLIAQTGLMGLACFLWFFVELGLLGLRLLKRIPEGFAKGYIYGALGGIAGTLVAGYLVDWVLPFVYNIGMNGFRASVLPWLFLGGVVSIEQIYRHQPASIS